MQRKSGAVERLGHKLELDEITRMQTVLMDMGAATHGAVQDVLAGQSKMLQRQSEDSKTLQTLTQAVGNLTIQNDTEALRRQIEQLEIFLRANVVHSVFKLISEDSRQRRQIVGGTYLRRKLIRAQNKDAIR
jgi:hypothetical protein